VLLNLLGNAVKFTDQGHVALRVTAADDGPRPPTEGTVVRLTFEVEDTGIGIASDRLADMFKAFEQVSEAERRAEGAGLGLAISREIVEFMGGRLQVKSQPGQGSTFWFTLSMPVTEPSAPEQPLARHVVGYAGRRRTVLVVDDQEYNCRLLVDLLQPLGFDVRTAEDGQQAVELTRTWNPDVILMDLVMPVKTGDQATAEIRRLPEREGVVIVIVSASVLDADEARSRLAGCDAFLRKPIKAAQLFEVLESHLDLTWIIDEPRGESSEATPALLVAPPREELVGLYQSARAGRIVEVQAQATRLAALDDAYRPFVERLHELARRFEIEQIAAFIREFLQERPDEGNGEGG
jgi:CheY-like chemotaxis protein